MLGSHAAEQIAKRAAGTELGEVMAQLAPEIEQDRQTLIDLRTRLGVDRNLAKEATAWAAEKLSRLKFSGATRGDHDFGLFIAVETMTLGVAGKLALWLALLDVSSDVAELDDTELEQLVRRARVQHATLETQRLRLARGVLASLR